MKHTLSRRQFIKTGLASTAGIILVACGNDGESATGLNYPEATQETDVVQLAPTPQCDDHDETLSQTEGPFYTSDTPQRTNLLEEGMAGTLLVVTGKVLTTDCRPIAGAILDFWHADDAGNYDNTGYLLRGHQYSDENGSFQLQTIVPGEYPGRTRHIHVKVQGPDTSLLTTQLYFPNEPGNNNDSIFDAALIIDMQDAENGKAGAFNFVLS
ncbi:MAG: intradiol ring-cleavage dioxygenase [Candidatus Promineifilaceae bacterium]